MPELIAGHHRLEAAKRLKWETIAAYVIDGADRDPAAVVSAELAGIDENFIRRDFSDAERAHLAAQIETMKQGGDRRSDQAANLPLVSQAQAASVLNVSERSVRSARAVLDRGAPELVEMVKQ